MTVLLVLATWVLLSLAACGLFVAVARGGKTPPKEGGRTVQISLPAQRVHQDLGAAARAGGRR